MQKTISVRDTFVQKPTKENFYHGILLGILSYKNEWRVSSNRESGEGFSDIVIEMGNAETGIVIEVKYTDEKKDLERDCRKALEQIRDKDYTQTLWQEGYKKMVQYGIAFHLKQCCVMEEEMQRKRNRDGALNSYINFIKKKRKETDHDENNRTYYFPFPLGQRVVSVL